MTRVKPAYLAAAGAFLVAALVSHLRASPYDNYVLLAQAFLHGHAWIDWPGPYIDALGYGGLHYIIEAPVPAIALLPLVAIFGTSANQTLLSAIFAAVAICATWTLGERFNLTATNVDEVMPILERLLDG